MTRNLVVLILIALAFALVPASPADAASGNGLTVRGRLPWQAASGQRELSQGWFGHGSHYSQYGDDFTNRDPQYHDISFRVLAATESEGNATCTPDTGGNSGNYIRIDRTYNNLTDWYFHLADGACTGFPRKVQQGDFLAWAGDTGSDGFIHLHFEPRGPGGGPADSVEHSLSGIGNFCDHNDTGYPDGHDGELGYQCSQAHNGEYYTSDNAGPGTGNGINPWGAGAMWLAYNDIGLYLASLSGCGASWGAWDCFGSSRNYYTEGFLATRSCLGTSNDCGWHQDFKKDGAWHDFNWPEACGGAYWIPDGFFTSWLQHTWLGQARSSVYQSGSYYYQEFRHGYLRSTTFGGSATAIAGGPAPPCLS